MVTKHTPSSVEKNKLKWDDTPNESPLWQRNIPDYPVYRKGNPQTRVLLPLFWMRLVKPSYQLPPDRLCFEVHHQMTKYDVKNYLEKIYNVPVLSVVTSFRAGEKRRDPIKSGALKPGPDTRLAHVTLKNQTFEFPDLYEEEKPESEKQIQEYAKYKKSSQEDLKQNWSKKDVPVWFR